MCIAIYIPEGKDITEKQIRNAFSNNPDGAGVMHYDRNGQVHWAKGFMDVEKLITYWKHSTSSKYPRAIHCRIATSGKISKGCCHPFPITDELDDMLVPNGISTSGCLIHNGIFSKYTPKEGMLCKYSDTMFYTKKVIYPLKSLLNNLGVEELLEDMTSRVLVFLPNYEVHRYGKWEYEKEQGFYASNDTYDYDYSYYESLRNRIYSTQYSSGTCYSLPTTTGKGGDYEYELEDEETNIHCYDITFKARDYAEADEVVYKFLDEMWHELTYAGCDDVLDTIEPCGDGDDWCFITEAKRDITNEILAQGLDIMYHYDKYGNEIGGE